MMKCSTGTDQRQHFIEIYLVYLSIRETSNKDVEKLN